MTVVAVIPARFGASRFPGKPLANKTGKPMIQHVFERVRQAKRIDRIVVATDDERILQAVKSFDGEARMTRADHVSGTDRVGEVAEALKLADDDIVLNVQGDEPEIEPTSLDRLVERMMNCEWRMADPNPERARRADPLVREYSRTSLRHADEPPVVPLGKGDGVRADARDQQSVSQRESLRSPSARTEVRGSLDQFTAGSKRVSIGTIAAPFDDTGPKEGPESPLDPNCVKVVVDLSGCAMYFSRSPIPYPRDTMGMIDRPSRWLLHMGVYAFRCETLRRLTGGRMMPSVLERAESLEQLRWLENGFRIAVETVEHRSVGIDTPEAYEAFVRRFGK